MRTSYHYSRTHQIITRVPNHHHHHHQVEPSRKPRMPKCPYKRSSVLPEVSIPLSKHSKNAIMISAPGHDPHVRSREEPHSSSSLRTFGASTSQSRGLKAARVKGYNSLWETAPESDQVQYHYFSITNRAWSAGHPDLITLVYWFASSGGMGTPDPDEGEGEESWRTH